MTFYVPIRTVSESNQREHWATKHRRNKRQQEAVGYAMLAVRPLLPKPPVLVTLTRFAYCRLDPGNLEASFKHVQDAVAKMLGVDDGDQVRVSWLYEQEKKRHYGIRITITPLTSD